jgi:hypothetical protein
LFVNLADLKTNFDFSTHGMVEQEGFRMFASKANSNFVLQHRTFYTKRLEEIFEREQEKVCDEFDDVIDCQDGCKNKRD